MIKVIRNVKAADLDNIDYLVNWEHRIISVCPEKTSAEVVDGHVIYSVITYLIVVEVIGK